MEDVQAGMDWSLLLPEISARLVDGTFTAQDLSAFIILFFVVITSLAVAYLCTRAAGATGSIDFLLDLLEGVTPEDVLAKRKAIRRAAQKSEHEGALWNRFDQTLVVSADGRSLYGSQDSGNFFSVRSIARDPVDSRVVAALPGILTSFGILGTVAVLQVGLGNPDFGGETGAPAQVLFNGVAVAFSTSVWGVGSGVLLQILGQGIDWLLGWRVGYLRQRVNRLFPRAGNAHLLINLEHYDDRGEVSHASLQTLVDEHMQNTLDGLASGVHAGISEAMAPALEKLAAVAERLEAQQAADRLEDVMADQRRALEAVAGDLAAAVSRLDERGNAAASALDERLERLVACAERQAAAFEEAAEALAQQHHSALAKADEALQHTLEGAEQFAAQARETKQRDKATKELIQELDTARYNIENTVDELKRRGQFASKTLDQLEVGYTAFLDTLSESAAESGERMSNLLIEYSQQLTEQARERTDVWKQMTEEFSGAMSGALNEVQAALKTAKPAAAAKKRATTRRKRPVAAAKSAPKDG